MANALAIKAETEAKEFRTLQKELSQLQQSRSRYLTTLNENEMVKKELELLEADAEVFKLTGPALLKQEKSEALANVAKRIDFIKGELNRLDTTEKDVTKKAEEKRNRVMELQNALMQQQAKAQQK